MLKPGDIVMEIADGTRFVVTTVEQSGHSPIVWTLDDGNNASVDASLGTVDDAERDRRASF